MVPSSVLPRAAAAFGVSWIPVTVIGRDHSSMATDPARPDRSCLAIPASYITGKATTIAAHHACITQPGW